MSRLVGRGRRQQNPTQDRRPRLACNIAGEWGPLVQQRKGDRPAPFRRCYHTHVQALSLAESCQSGTLNDGNMHEHVLAAIVANGKPKPLITFEPLDRSLDGRCR
jgi:hypothetical protein